MGEGLLQPTHLLLIMMLALLLFGAGKLSDTGAALGRSVREFRSAVRSDEPTAAGRERTCPECNARVQGSAQFCASCGASLKRESL